MALSAIPGRRRGITVQALFVAWFYLELGAVAAAASEFFVDCEAGDDTHSGLTPEAAFRTLDRARLASRGSASEVVVSVLPGDCFPMAAGSTAVNFSLAVLTLSAADSGTAAAPVSYVAAAGPGSTRLLAGASLNASLWQTYNGSILQLDLAAAGVAQWGVGGLASGGLGACSNTDRLELFFGGQPMTLARYPNVPLGARPTAASFLQVGTVEGTFAFSAPVPRMLAWGAEADPWLHGFWAEDWADNHVHALGFKATGVGNVSVAIDPATPPTYGLKPRGRFYGENLLCELDTPGEYYVDALRGRLYFYPPAPVTTAEAFVSIGQNAVVIANASHVSLDGFVMSFARNSGVGIANGGGLFPCPNHRHRVALLARFPLPALIQLCSQTSTSAITAGLE